MKEATLLKVALTASVIGIMGLFMLSETVSVDETAISKLEGVQDESVKLTGLVKQVSERGNATFLTLEKREEVTAVLFSRGSVYRGGLKAGDKVAVVGKVSEYQGEEEIIADKVNRIG